jgi:hypothetical protein
MQVIFEGASAVVRVQALDEAKTAQVIAGWTVSAAWHAGAGVTPATPAITTTDATTRTVVASSAGLGGRSASLRVTATDPVSGRVYIADALYLVST